MRTCPLSHGLSVVVPVHNECAALPRILSELSALLTARFADQHELILVDDASTDSSTQILKQWRHHPRVTLLRQPFRQGSGAARRLGSRHAKFSLCAWIDADGSYSADDLLRLCDTLADADQNIGVRTRETGRHRLLRWAVKLLARQLASLLWQRAIPDLNSGLRVFRTARMAAWLNGLPDGFSCTSSATLLALNHRQQVVFTPVSYLPRVGKSKFHVVTDTFRLFRVVIRQRCAGARGPLPTVTVPPAA